MLTTLMVGFSGFVLLFFGMTGLRYGLERVRTETAARGLGGEGVGS
jgi:hypothetical protein